MVAGHSHVISFLFHANDTCSPDAFCALNCTDFGVDVTFLPDNLESFDSARQHDERSQSKRRKGKERIGGVLEVEDHLPIDSHTEKAP